MRVLVVSGAVYGDADRIDRAVSGAFDGRGDARVASVGEAPGLDRVWLDLPFFGAPAQRPGLPAASRGLPENPPKKRRNAPPPAFGALDHGARLIGRSAVSRALRTAPPRRTTANSTTAGVERTRR